MWCSGRIIYCLCTIYQVSEIYATSLDRMMIVLVENLLSLHQSMHYVAFGSFLLSIGFLYLPGIGDLRYVPREADDRIGREFTEPPPVHALCGVWVTLTLYTIYQVSETYATSLERLMIVLVENLPSLHQSMHYVAFRSR